MQYDAKYWLGELEHAKKRLRKFHKQGDEINNRFLDEERKSTTDEDSRLNLFHKNVTTIQNMMVGQNPKTDVKREHNDPSDDVARVAANIMQRLLSANPDVVCNPLRDVLRQALQDRLLPGLGVCRMMYTVETETQTITNPLNFETEEVEVMVSESCIPKYWHWRDCLWGWTRTYSDLPWWAFRSWMTKKEVKDRFGEEHFSQLQYKSQNPGSDEQKEGHDTEDGTKKAEIWEIWCKTTRTVYWVSPGYHKKLDEKDDPLGLKGFYPMPRPMMANLTTKQLVPKGDFVLAQDLYNEIDVLQTRIHYITHAIKVIGVYDKNAGDSVGRMLTQGRENDLIPVDNWAMFAEKGGMKGVVDWFPVEVAVGVLQNLQQIQSDKISQLYEITGLSDIMRGANTDQYTAARTQAQKAKMGSIQIQALQDEFSRFASDLQAIKAEIVSKHYDDSSILKESSAQYLPQADLQLITPALELIRSPEAGFRVDIKPESVSMLDYAQQQQERTEFLFGMAQFVQSATAAAQTVPGSMPMLLELLRWAMSSYKGADQLEGTFDQALEAAKKALQQPQQQDNSAQVEQLKAQAAQQLEQLKAQNDQAKIQAKAQADIATTRAKMEAELAKIRTDAERDERLENLQSQYALLEIAEELAAQLREQEEAHRQALELEAVQGRVDMAVDDNDHRNKVAELRLSRSAG